MSHIYPSVLHEETRENDPEKTTHRWRTTNLNNRNDAISTSSAPPSDAFYWLTPLPHVSMLPSNGFRRPRYLVAASSGANHRIKSKPAETGENRFKNRSDSSKWPTRRQNNGARMNFRRMVRPRAPQRCARHFPRMTD